ncbi:MAG TPA: hypothetical protein VGL98_08570, partial [Gammaproteobacteria bacterium]
MPTPEPIVPSAPKRETTWPSVGHDQRGAVVGAADGLGGGRLEGARAAGAADVEGRGVVVA